MAAAGPIVNICLAIGICFLPSFKEQLTCVYANLLIGIFNLIPIYPLDGGRVVKYVLRNFMEVSVAEKSIYIISMVSLVLVTILGVIGGIWLQNVALIMIVCYLWGVYVIERKRYRLKMRVYEMINKNTA